MPAANFNPVIEAGATYRLALTVRNGPTTAAPPMDLTGWEPRMQLRPAADSLDVLLDCRPANGRLSIADAAAGQILLNIPASDTARLDFAAAVYDLIIASAGETRRLLQGEVKISPAVTR